MYDYVPDSVLVNYAAMDITVGQKTSAYSKVVLVNADGDEFSSGTDEGMTLRVDLPWATQSDADNLLAKFAGRRYQSYTARDSFVSPDADLGEMVRVAGVKSSILNKRTEFGRQISSTISAPGEEELDHEYEYVTRVDREAQRQRSYFGGAIGRMQKKLNESIDEVNDDILENYNELVAALNGDDGAPEDLKAGIANYVRWDLKNGEGFAGTKLFSEIGNKAKSEIDVYTYVDKDGNKHSLVDVIAKVDDTESGLATKVGTADLTATLKNYALAASLNDYLTVKAAAELYVTDDDVTATIGAYIVTDASGNKKTLAAILADVIKLQGDTEILGNLSIVNGRLNVSRSLQASTVFASGLTIDSSVKYPIRVGSGYLGASTTAYFESDGITLGATKYSPQEITSTDGQKHTALGHAS